MKKFYIYLNDTQACKSMLFEVQAKDKDDAVKEFSLKFLPYLEPFDEDSIITMLSAADIDFDIIDGEFIKL